MKAALETLAGVVGLFALAALVESLPSCAHRIQQSIASAAPSAGPPPACPREPMRAPFLCDRVTDTMECAICSDDLKNCKTAHAIYCVSSCDVPECQPRNQRPKP
jgi:hypothetical protein